MYFNCRAFGILLRQRRGEAGLSQKALAKRAGVHYTYISHIERENQPMNRVPSLDVLYGLAKGLGIHPAELLPEPGEE